MYRISIARKRAGLSQEELGERIGVTQQQVARWESGRVDLGAKTVLKLCSALGVDASWLLGQDVLPEDVSPEEAAVLSDWRASSDVGRKLIADVASDVARRLPAS